MILVLIMIANDGLKWKGVHKTYAEIIKDKNDRVVTRIRNNCGAIYVS